MEVNPTAVAVLGIVALRLAGCHAVENLVERLTVDIAEYNIKILTKWYIAVAMNDKITHDALAAQSQVPITPLVVESQKVKVLLCLMDALRNLLHKV